MAEPERVQVPDEPGMDEPGMNEPGMDELVRVACGRSLTEILPR